MRLAILGSRRIRKILHVTMSAHTCKVSFVYLAQNTGLCVLAYSIVCVHFGRRLSLLPGGIDNQGLHIRSRVSSFKGAMACPKCWKLREF